MNTMKTVLLMGLLTGLVVFVGDLAGGRQGMYIALGIAAVMNLVSYWFSDKIVLAMYRAQPVDYSSAPRLYSMVQRLTQRAGLPMPALYVIPTPTPNAFATGRDPQHAAVAVTDGIVRMLTEEELEGVIAHELSHVRNRDILISAIAATLAGALMILARILGYSMLFFGGGGDRDRNGGGLGALFAIIFAPIAAMLIQMAISRSREFQADSSAAALTHNPMGLARALGKLARGNEAIPMDAEPSTAHMFIVSPLSGRSFVNLFSTHPPLEARIERLEKMAREGGTG
ncbi:MAG: zinc metalloprotease HtpX [Armatimonadetes bacterium]|nr:zinc metalloprotease HtpX [Armatimonadota bacterium]MDI9586183.1 zinc metalloprotease HtpX [Acidobacteriota bacterium]